MKYIFTVIMIMCLPTLFAETILTSNLSLGAESAGRAGTSNIVFANSFTTSTSPFEVTDVTLMSQFTNGASGLDVSVTIHESDGPNSITPGTLIGSFNHTGNVGFRLENFALDNSLVLDANTTYWIQVQGTDNDPNLALDWFVGGGDIQDGPGTIGDLLSSSSNGGASFATPGNLREFRFSVNNSAPAVPEPSTYIAFLLGLFMIGYFQRKANDKLKR